MSYKLLLWHGREGDEIQEQVWAVEHNSGDNIIGVWGPIGRRFATEMRRKRATNKWLNGRMIRHKVVIEVIEKRLDDNQFRDFNHVVLRARAINNSYKYSHSERGRAAAAAAAKRKYWRDPKKQILRVKEYRQGPEARKLVRAADRRRYWANDERREREKARKCEYRAKRKEMLCGL